MNFFKNLSAGIQTAIAKLKQQITRLIPGKSSTVLKMLEQTNETLSLSNLPDLNALKVMSQKFPPSFQQAFLSGPLTDNLDFFVGREKELECLKNILDRWQNKQRAAVALIGPDACGRTTLFNHLAANLLRSETISRITLHERILTENKLVSACSAGIQISPPAAATEDLLTAISSQNRQVVLVDDAQFLYLRTMGSEAALKNFFKILQKTRDHFLWIVSFSEQAWRRLDYLYDLKRCFSDVVELPYFTEPELTQALELRTAATGLPFGCESDEVNGSKDACAIDASASDEQLATLCRCSAKLFALSGGNMQAALFFWHLYTRLDPASNTIVFNAKPPLDMSPLQGLDRSVLLSLAELVAHGGLAPAELAQIFQIPVADSLHIIEYLRQLQILEVVPASANSPDNRVKINPAFYRPVTSLLTTHNFLY